MSTKYRRRRHRRGRRALTIPQFCRKYTLSRSTYFDMQKRGLGPTEMRITERTIRISPRAEDEWVAKMEAGQSARVPVFAARSDGGATEVGGTDHTIARQQKKRQKDESRRLQSVPRNERPSQPAPKSSANRKQRDGLGALPRRQNKRSKRAAPACTACAPTEGPAPLVFRERGLGAGRQILQQLSAAGTPAAPRTRYRAAAVRCHP